MCCDLKVTSTAAGPPSLSSPLWKQLYENKKSISSPQHTFNAHLVETSTTMPRRFPLQHDISLLRGYALLFKWQDELQSYSIRIRLETLFASLEM